MWTCQSRSYTNPNCSPNAEPKDNPNVNPNVTHDATHMGSVPSKVRNCANAQYHQTICAVKSHSCALAISKFKSKMIFNIIFGQNASALIAFILLYFNHFTVC